MLTVKEKIFAFLVTVVIVALINVMLVYHNEKDYTLLYPETIADVQKNIDKDIVKIKDKAVTKGSVLLLVEMKDGAIKMCHLNRGYLTSRYECHIFEGAKERGEMLIKGNFENFICKIDQYDRIEINPTTFTSSTIELYDLMMLWLMPGMVIFETLMYFIKKKKEKAVCIKEAVG